MYLQFKRYVMFEKEDISNIENNSLQDRRSELEALIAENSSLIDILKDACELNIEMDYISNIHSALSVISKKQMKTLMLISELQ